MNKALAAISAAVIAIVAFLIGFNMHPLSDVNPVGFHAKGQVQINGSNTLNAANCTSTSTKPCTLTFDFSLDPKVAPSQQLNCDKGANCLSFSNQANDTLEVTVTDAAGGSGTTYQDYVNGRVVVSP